MRVLCYFICIAVCHLLEKRVYGMLGAFHTCALTTIQSYTDTFNVPFIALSMPQLSSSEDPYQLYIRPSYIAGVLDIVSKKQWKKIYYIYESNEGKVSVVLFQLIYIYFMFGISLTREKKTLYDHIISIRKGTFN